MKVESLSDHLRLGRGSAMCRWWLCALAMLYSPSAASTALAAAPALLNRTGLPAAPGNGNGTATAFDSVTSIVRHFSTFKNLVLAASAGAFLLILCLLVRVIRSRRKLRKTRKYDIITTPAEKVEMTPLNEDNDDDEDATVFDVKYSR
ncbi:membrane protein FAM174B [Heptranchias perlo]|uniref:membrane protein FAM174B n=1 Tax=Heptranchias perlo TaxID=212740 RepID=UPI003559CE3E